MAKCNFIKQNAQNWKLNFFVDNQETHSIKDKQQNGYILVFNANATIFMINICYDPYDIYAIDSFKPEVE